MNVLLSSGAARTPFKRVVATNLVKAGLYAL